MNHTQTLTAHALRRSARIDNTQFPRRHGYPAQSQCPDEYQDALAEQDMDANEEELQAYIDGIPYHRHDA